MIAYVTNAPDNIAASTMLMPAAAAVPATADAPNLFLILQIRFINHHAPCFRAGELFGTSDLY
jgi:hypothetical protein